MAWPNDPRPAKSLIKLRDQINAAHPNRSKASDGMIGDAAHQADKTSDHNPNAQGVVCAFDITHDPDNGVDIDKLSDALVASRDSRIKYLIANGLICVPDDYGWGWFDYTGIDPHTNHLHISVDDDYDNQADWNIGEGEEEMVNEPTCRWIIEQTTGRSPVGRELEDRVGKYPPEYVIKEYLESPEGVTYRKKKDADVQDLIKRANAKTAVVDEATKKKIADLQSTLSALIK